MRAPWLVVALCLVGVLAASDGSVIEELTSESVSVPLSAPAAKHTDAEAAPELGEDDYDNDIDAAGADKDREAQEKEARDARVVGREGARDMEDGVDNLGESKSGKTDFTTNLYVEANKQRLRVGSAWGMPGLYSSDGGNRDLILGTAGGKKVYFGIGRNDAWIQASTGHMWLKGSITVKNYAHFFAEKQRLRVGAVWGMPGIYASDGANRDMSLGTAAGKKIYFGVHRQDAWIQAGTGHMWLKGSLTVKNYGHFFAEGQRLRVGAVWGMAGIYASDGGENRDMILGTAAGKKIYFGIKKNDAWIQAGTGHMFLKGKMEANMNSHFKAGGKTLRVGAAFGMPGLYASDGGADDLILGTTSGRRIYFGVSKQNAWIQAGTGHMWLKGSITAEQNGFFLSEKQKLRVGSVWGMPGLYASDGEARDLVLGTRKGRKVYFGVHRKDAWIQAGSGDSWFAGSMTVNNNINIAVAGQKLRVGTYGGMPGLFSSDDAPRDLMLGVAKKQKGVFWIWDWRRIRDGWCWLALAQRLARGSQQYFRLLREEPPEDRICEWHSWTLLLGRERTRLDARHC